MSNEQDSPPDSSWLMTAILVLALLTILGAYITSLRLVVATSPTETPNERDSLYFGLHGISLLLALVLGGVVGYFHQRRVFAIAVLYLSVTLFVMFAAQLISFELACAGHNDIIRHWRCE